ncbi:ACT domain-containing protein [Mumia zhuanghuii]|uniref:ACT domain-containing protein n=2 Tax=Mumia TaxID=1546255 RepID=A0ABW1QSV4_9ACTN|nr:MULTISPECIES: ACT domain-containing protein [Mumia]KAA1425054.1 ACT domain-containing protein [Mumia zhuanghuii]
MAFLLRIELPDVPGSLGAVATALGGAGADIHAIEIVEHRSDGKAVDDVLLELPVTTMPDKLITACHHLEGVRVQWISRYNAGANLSMDLEAVEAFTAEPARALESLTEKIPETFRADWALLVARAHVGLHVLHATPTAPERVPDVEAWFTMDHAQRLSPVADWGSMVLAGAPVPHRDAAVLFGRHGGPPILDSEIARLGHIVGLAASVSAAV